eukprot:gb/GECG01012381.1/.p1 GENE.gb/GECG01012381.1/~~gb/GECG01012381.1/.p1  ORF type:complete len:154 (+),score=11.77 gb/GECG01012381.1/:1-462(+)
MFQRRVPLVSLLLGLCFVCYWMKCSGLTSRTKNILPSVENRVYISFLVGNSVRAPTQSSSQTFAYRPFFRSSRKEYSVAPEDRQFTHASQLLYNHDKVFGPSKGKMTSEQGPILLDGKATSAKIREELKEKCEALKAKDASMVRPRYLQLTGA